MKRYFQGYKLCDTPEIHLLYYFVNLKNVQHNFSSLKLSFTYVFLLRFSVYFPGHPTFYYTNRTTHKVKYDFIFLYLVKQKVLQYFYILIKRLQDSKNHIVQDII